MTVKINSWGVISLGAIGLVILLTIVSSVEGSAIRNSQDGSSHHVIRKRNAWWSKKSVDDNRITEAHKAAIAEQTFQDLQDLQEVRESIVCYTQECVPDFVYCSRQIVITSQFYQCKMQHRLCSDRCFNNPTSIPDEI